jgi:hypothetical protein
MLKRWLRRWLTLRAWRWWLLLVPLLVAAVALLHFMRPEKPAESKPAEIIPLPTLRSGEMPRAYDLLTGELVSEISYQQDRLGDEVRVTVRAPHYFEQIFWLKPGDPMRPVLNLAPTDADRYRAVAWQAEPAPRLIVLQLDAVTEVLFAKFRADGLLPAFEVLLERGASGPLLSCCDLLSPSVWTTINTGLPPEEHGVRGYVQNDPQTGALLSVTKTDIRAPRLWELARAQKKTALVGGVMLGDPHDDFLGPHVMMPEKYFLTREALRRKGVPALLVVFDPIADNFGHLWWKTFEPDKFRATQWPLPDEAVRFHGDHLKQAYRDLNAWVGMALRLAGPETTILIMSDHGFEGHPEYLPYHVNSAEMVKALSPVLPGVRACDADRPDQLVLCLEPGQPTGPGAEILATARLADGAPLFSEVTHRDQPGFGHEGSAALAYRLMMNRRGLWEKSNLEGPITVGAVSFAASTVLSEGHSGDHLSYGLFFVAGANVNSGATIDAPSVYDIMPNALALLGMPVAKDMPGRVWQEAYRTAPVVRLVDTYGRERKPFTPVAPTDEELERLRSLGYIN